MEKMRVFLGKKVSITLPMLAWILIAITFVLLIAAQAVAKEAKAAQVDLTWDRSDPPPAECHLYQRTEGFRYYQINEYRSYFHNRDKAITARYRPGYIYNP